ncbi:MAG TPA: hypothetical protein VHC70_13250 [Phycisphaerales bacterium]|nr:hypothetical protein [Phycisphaerales bacterium]
MSAKRRVRWKPILLAIAAAVALIVAWQVWVASDTWAEERRMAQAEAWGKTIEPKLSTIEGVGFVMIYVPRRYHSDKPPTWGLVLEAAVLDDAAEQRLRAAISTESPPKPPRLSFINCYGDKAIFDDMVRQHKSE